MKYFNLFFSLLLSVSVILTGCKDEDPISEQTAPTLPPISSFEMDFSTFPSNQSQTGRMQTEAYKNWGYAFLNIALWQAGLGLHLALPVAAFNESFKHDPVYVSEKQKWQWSYQITHGGQTYEAKLLAKLANAEVSWEMYISKDGAFTDFLWFEGVSKFDKTGGSWKVNADPMGESRPYLMITWQNTDEIKEIKYTGIDQKDQQIGSGSYIHYGFSPTEDFNCFYDIYIKKDNNLVEIEFHTETREGRIKSQTFFGKDAWHCWNPDLINTSCQ